MADSQDYLSGANIGFIESLYARWLEDPAAVDESWRAVFSRLAREGRPIFPAPEPPGPALKPPAVTGGAAAAMVLQARAGQVIYAYRLRGHLLADLDPLELPRAKPSPAELGLLGEGDFTPEELATGVDPSDVFERGPVPLSELLGRLRRTYCRRVGAETVQVQEGDARQWLQEQMEWTENRPPFAPDERRRLLERLSDAQAFENVAHTRFVGAKRFSLEGGESLIPMIDALLEVGGRTGLEEVVLGMGHRGRLNVLTNVLGKPPYEMFSEFLGPADVRPWLGRGDVKYHLGFSSDLTLRGGKRVHVSVAFNPSHLEAVYPVVEGRVRAKQDRAGDVGGARCLPLVLHGDASFIGQGVVSETLNLARLTAYRTGGTVHVVVDNQVGFTTEAEQGRSARYCTAIARLLGIPILHVNGDDPEACVHVMRLAAEYRQRFRSDVVVDLVCYRRWGHNEGDEPAFTQPVMYERIRSHPPVREVYAGQLLADGLLSAEEIEAGWLRCRERFQAAQEKAKEAPRVLEPSFNQGLWQTYRGGPEREVPEVDTFVARERLARVAAKLSAVPEGFTPHPKIARLLEQRREMGEGLRPLDWGMAELLALGTLLGDGHPVRLTGQDTERGTFSQRHAVLHDARTGAQHCPLCELSPVQGDCLVANSPLSEAGCLGFEFGYSLDFPDALVAWEAQYGDFANSAQVFIDQFVAAAEDKWRRLSGLTLLLPHGFEGQGPEHSSARLERFLQLCAEDNLQVCVPTTPAQQFHLLRRQVLRAWRKPLVVMTPKSLLRLPAATSSLDALCSGRFERVLRDRPGIDPAAVTRLLLCSGKIFYELARARDEKKDAALAIVRLEQLYPFPAEELTQILRGMPKLGEVCWVQEEPRNAGAWRFVEERFQEMPSVPGPRYIGRVASASPATGFHGAHALEQSLIVTEATTREGAQMAVEVTVPQLGESITEAVVGKWRKAVGDAVAVDEPVVVLETDKVTVDVPAPVGGTLERIARKEGERVKVGEVLATITPGAKAARGAAEGVAPARAAERAAAGVAPGRAAERGAAEGAAPGRAAEREAARGPAEGAAPARAAEHGAGPAREEHGAAAYRPAFDRGATPVARKIAHERGLDLSAVPGTGPGGRVLKEDVLGYTAAPPAAPAAARPTGPREERVRMTPLRKRVAERLLAAQTNAAILTTFNEADLGAVLELRKLHGERFEKKHGVRLGLMSFFVAAAIEALKAFPEVNAEIDGEDVVFKRYYDIGVAVSGSRGLVVPVVRDADTLSLAEIERQIADLADKARTDRLTLADLQGGTFTISNGGIFGSMLSTPILNPPQTGILGMHAIKDRPVAREGQVVIRPMMYLALSYDHRLIDGREAVQFLIRIKDCIEDPRRLLLEI